MRFGLFFVFVFLMGFSPSVQDSSVLTVMTSFKPHKTDTETAEQRKDRLRGIADAMEKAADRAACVGKPKDCKVVYADARSMRALLVTIARHESYLAQYVHEDRCLDGPPGERCDCCDSEGMPRAKSIFQIWRVAIQPNSDWYRLGGTSQDANDLAAWTAAKRLSGARTRCESTYPEDPIRGAIAGFAGGCLSLPKKKLDARMHTYYSVLRRL